MAHPVGELGGPVCECYAMGGTNVRMVVGPWGQLLTEAVGAEEDLRAQPQGPGHW